MDSIAEFGENEKIRLPSQGTSWGTDAFDLKLDRSARVPLFLQIAAAIRQGFRDGKLRRGRTLPSTRSLAVQLGVSRNTAIQAYEELAADGLIDSRPGSRTRIGKNPAPTPAPVHWRSLLSGSGYPARSASCADPDGIGLYLFASLGRQR